MKPYTISTFGLVLVGAAVLCSAAGGRQGIVSKAPGWVFATSGPLVPGGQSETGFQIGVDRFERHGDSASLTIFSDRATASGWRAGMQAILANDYRGKRIRFSGYVKSLAVAGSCGLWLRIDLAHGDILSMGPERSLSGTKDWTPCAAVFDVPADAKDICFGPILEGKGRVWLADLKLEAVDAKAIPQTPRADTVNDAKPVKAPANLSFSGSWIEGVPFGWEPIEKKAFQAHIVAKETYKGKPVLAFDGKKDGFDGVRQSVKVGAFAGKRLNLSGWFKSAHIQGNGDLVLGFTDKSGAKLAFGELNEENPKRSLKGTVGWTKREIVLDVPAKSQVIWILVGLDGTGTLEVSGLQLRAVSTAVATTQNLVKPQTAEKTNDLSALPLAARNLQFNM